MKMELVDFIVADDIRHESGLKLSLMGIYAEDYILAPRQEESWPVLVPLTIYLRIKHNDEEFSAFELDFLLDNEYQGQAAGTILSQTPGKMLTLVIQANPFPIAKEGELRFALRLKGPDQIYTLDPQYSLRIHQERLEKGGIQESSEISS